MPALVPEIIAIHFVRVRVADATTNDEENRNSFALLCSSEDWSAALEAAEAAAAGVAELEKKLKKRGLLNMHRRLG